MFGITAIRMLISIRKSAETGFLLSSLATMGASSNMVSGGSGM